MLKLQYLKYIFFADGTCMWGEIKDENYIKDKAEVKKISTFSFKNTP